MLESTRWVNDSILSAAQHLLRDQCKGVFGWSSPQCTKRSVAEKFAPIPAKSLFVQILHVGGCHWITSTNVDAQGGNLSYSPNTVRVYDSMMNLEVSLATQLDICQFLKPEADRIIFDVMNVEQQQNTHDCGIYAIAFATELAYGHDPVLHKFEAGEMRSHLLHCLEKKKMERYFSSGTRNIPMGRRVRKSIPIIVYCICRLPNDPTLLMVECNNCRGWFHTRCLTFPSDTKATVSYGHKWQCNKCKQFINTIKSH